jgi:hypothetical protein
MLASTIFFAAGTANTFTIQGQLLEFHHVNNPNRVKGEVQVIFNTTNGLTAINYRNSDYMVNWNVNNSYVLFLSQKFDGSIYLDKVVEVGSK